MKALYSLILTALIVPGIASAAPSHTAQLSDNTASVGSGSGVSAPSGCEWVDFSMQLDFTPQGADINIGDIHFQIADSGGIVFWDQPILGTLENYQELDTQIVSDVVTLERPCPFLGSNTNTFPPREEGITPIQNGTTDSVSVDVRVARGSTSPDGIVRDYQMKIVGYAYEYENEVESAPLVISHVNTEADVQSNTRGTLIDVSTEVTNDDQEMIIYREYRDTTSDSLVYHDVVNTTGNSVYNSVWSNPTPGEYRVDVGLFSNDWQTTYEWTQGATKFIVSPQKSIDTEQLLASFENDPDYGVIKKLVELFASLGII